MIAPDVEKLADDIKGISRGMTKALDSGLTRRCLVILIHHSTGSPKVPMKTIEAVLDSIERLEENYCVDPDATDVPT